MVLLLCGDALDGLVSGGPGDPGLDLRPAAARGGRAGLYPGARLALRSVDDLPAHAPMGADVAPDRSTSGSGPSMTCCSGAARSRSPSPLRGSTDQHVPLDGRLQVASGVVFVLVAIVALRPIVHRDGEGRAAGRLPGRGGLGRRFLLRRTVGDDPMLWKERYAPRTRGLIKLLIGFVSVVGRRYPRLYHLPFAVPAFVELRDHGYTRNGSVPRAAEFNDYLRGMYVALRRVVPGGCEPGGRRGGRRARGGHVDQPDLDTPGWRGDPPGQDVRRRLGDALGAGSCCSSSGSSAWRRGGTPDRLRGDRHRDCRVPLVRRRTRVSLSLTA